MSLPAVKERQLHYLHMPNKLNFAFDYYIFLNVGHPEMRIHGMGTQRGERDHLSVWHYVRTDRAGFVPSALQYAVHVTVENEGQKAARLQREEQREKEGLAFASERAREANALLVLMLMLMLGVGNQKESRVGSVLFYLCTIFSKCEKVACSYISVAIYWTSNH